VLRTLALRALSRVLRCARAGYAREGSSSFFPPAHYRRARFGCVFRVKDGVCYMKWWRRRCEVGIRKPGHRLSRPPPLCFAKLLFQPTIQLRTENPISSRGNVSVAARRRPTDRAMSLRDGLMGTANGGLSAEGRLLRAGVCCEGRLLREGRHGHEILNSPLQLLQVQAQEVRGL
jgi:hypothetical protein